MLDEHCDLLCIDLPRAEGLRQRRLSGEMAAVIARRTRALSDPTRLNLLHALHAGGELCVCDLSWIVAKPQNLTSHHVRSLKIAGLARSRRAGKIVFYSLTGEGIRLHRLLIEESALHAGPLEARG